MLMQLLNLETQLNILINSSIFNLAMIFLFVLYSNVRRMLDEKINSSILFILNIMLIISLIFEMCLALLIAIKMSRVIPVTFFGPGNENIHIASSLSFYALNLPLQLDYFGALLICLAFFIGLLSLLASDTRLKIYGSNLFIYFHIFIAIVLGFVLIQNFYILFLFYELLLIPSFLFIFRSSYTRKAIQASLYFGIWTQVGSIIVLIAIIYLHTITGCMNFNNLNSFKFKKEELIVLYVLFFFGFGIKVPIWPFHYWLTKVHVESPSGFSIFLSGFLVKAALYGFYKFTSVLSFEMSSLFFVTIALIGVLDASVKLWGQGDLKRIIAYCTIQEMNMIYLLFLIGDTRVLTCGAVFTVAHAFLSGMMFFLVDCVYRRFHTRSIFALHGLFQQVPSLSIVIVIMVVLYAGIPGTLKFTCEINLMIMLISHGLTVPCLILMAVNIIGIIGFSKNWFNVIFCLPLKEFDIPILDLSRKELLIFIYIIFFFITANGMVLFL